ncbi:MAG: hypothetical protein ACI8R4_002543 [Paracoccaceae bacterium]|jgi:hypothetical protein
MLTDIFTAYINTMTILVLGTALALVAVNAAGAVGHGLTVRQVPRLLGGMALLLGLWAALATYVAQLGVMGQAPFAFAPPWVGWFFVGGAVLLFALGRLASPARVVIDRMGQNYFMGIQSFRMLGGVFLLGWAVGDIPWIFALPAGFGDIWAGIAGYRAMQAVNRGDPKARRLVVQANVIGTVDFTVALITGLITSETVYQLMAHDAPNIVGAYPLVMIPALLVPVFLAAHFFSIQRLMRNPARTGDTAPVATPG